MDVDFYEVGDEVTVVPLGDYASAVTLTITAIVGNVVTLSGAHGLAGPDYGHVRPAAYDSASSRHQGYAFLADSVPSLGAAGDDAKQYV